MTDRRRFLQFLAGGVGFSAILRAASAGHKIHIVEFDAAGKKTGTSEVDKVVKTEAEWKQQLTPIQFQVTRHEGTERAFTGIYAETHEDGLYHCICCATTLFDSKTKFDSGTGWPSFFAPIAEQNVTKASDFSFGSVRTKVSCARCEAHLGHVFNDGPRPTGLRYCMNSASLNFVARSHA